MEKIAPTLPLHPDGQTVRCWRAMPLGLVSFVTARSPIDAADRCEPRAIGARTGRGHAVAPPPERRTTPRLRLPWIRLAATMLIVTAPIALPGACFANWPDPTWVPGIYDEADGDDVVQLVTDTAATADVASYQPVMTPGSAQDVVVCEVGT